MAHGAEALAALAPLASMGVLELTVLLDVIADRVTAQTDYRFATARTTSSRWRRSQVLQRDVIDIEGARALGGPAHRVGAGSTSATTDLPLSDSGNVQAFLRALYVAALARARGHPAVARDLMLMLIESLRSTNPDYLIPAASASGSVQPMTESTDEHDRRPSEETLTGHGGDQAVAVPAPTAWTPCSPCRGHTSSRCTTGRCKADPPMRLLDVRHEQTAVFAAEAIGKLTRRARSRRADRRARHHQRRQPDDPGAVQRRAAGGGRRPRPRQPLGQRAACRSSTTRRWWPR